MRLPRRKDVCFIGFFEGDKVYSTEPWLAPTTGRAFGSQGFGPFADNVCAFLKVRFYVQLVGQHSSGAYAGDLVLDPADLLPSGLENHISLAKCRLCEGNLLRQLCYQVGIERAAYRELARRWCFSGRWRECGHGAGRRGWERSGRRGVRWRAIIMAQELRCPLRGSHRRP